MTTRPPQFLLDWAEDRKAFWDAPDRGLCANAGTDTACANAGDDNVILHDRNGVKLCSSCYRNKATFDRVSFSYPCDDCGGADAFRDPMPRDDVMRCRACHEKNGYVPGERAMVYKIKERVGWTHSQGKKEVCSAAGRGTVCRGEVKPRGRNGVLCSFHNNPSLYR